MARIYGLNGILRGRQGNNVFSVQNGTQVVKAYQPVVSNPRTFPQQIQRSKFALAGKLSAVVPSGALVGLDGGNKRSRRSVFVGLIAKNATITTSQSGSGVSVNASIAYDKIVFSQGSLGRYTYFSGSTAAYVTDNNEVRVRVSVPGYSTNPIAADAPEGYGELVIVCMFDPTGSRLDGCQYAVRTDAAMQFDFAVSSATGCHVTIYLVPFAPVDGVNAFSADGNLADGSGDVSLMMSSDTYLAGMKFGNSRWVVTRPLVAPSSMHSPSPDDNTRQKK